MNIQNKVSVGDGVFAYYDGYHVWLEANIPTTDRIALDYHVVNSLLEYIQQLKAAQHKVPELEKGAVIND